MSNDASSVPHSTTAITVAPVSVPPARGSWLVPISAWLVTRVICVVCLYLGAAFWPVEKVYDLRNANAHAGDYDDLRAYFQRYKAEFGEPQWRMKSPMIGVSPGGDWAWAKPLIRWDSVWWLSVVEVGYVADPKVPVEQNVVFYPLYPLLIYGLKLVGIHPIIGSLLIANVVMLLATCLFYQTAVEQFGANAARWTIWLWLLFPTSFFGTVPYSEPLMILFSVLVMRSFLAQKYVISGLWSGVASALRNQGVLLGAALLVPFFAGPKRGRALVGGLCAGLGLLVYMGYQWQNYGDPLYFLQAQKIWRPKINEASSPLLPLMQAIGSLNHSVQLLLRGGIPWEYYSGRICDPWLGLWVLIWLPAVRKWNAGLCLSCVAMLLLPMATGTLASLGRYVWVLLPVFMVQGAWLQSRGSRWLVVLLSLIMLIWQSFLYGGGWEVI